MIYKLLLGYFRAKFFRLLIATVLGKKGPSKNLKTLTFIEYGLELFNAFLIENKKTKPRVRK